MEETITIADAPSLTDLELLRFQATLQIYCVDMVQNPTTASPSSATAQADALLAALALTPAAASVATVATSGGVKT